MTTEDALREQYMAWYLHCLVVTHRTQEIILALGRYHVKGMLSRLELYTVKEILVALPKEVLNKEGGPITIESVLAERLISDIHTFSSTPPRMRNASSTSPSVSSRPGFHVPIVTTDVILYARMVDYVLNNICAAGSRPEYEARLLDLQTLFSLANTDSLAASIVPTRVPIESVMVAENDERRSRRIGVLGHTMRQVIKHLCVYSRSVDRITIPATWLQEPSPVVDRAIQLGVGLLSKLLMLCSSRGNGLAVRTAEPKWRQRLRETTAVRTHKYQLLLSELPHADLSVIVQTLLSGGFVCEGGELGWCLLDSEMVDLRFYSLFTLGLLYQALGALLKDPRPARFTCEHRPRTCSNVSNSKSKGDAMNEVKGSNINRYDAVLTQLRVLYKRRQEVFGEELLRFQPITPYAAAHTLEEADHGFSECQITEKHPTSLLPGVSVPGGHSLSPPMLLGSSPVVVDVVWKLGDCGSAYDPRVRHLVHCLRNRSMVTPEGKLVLDCQRRTFDGWVLKGEATTTA
ncbi:unnamed protein product [Phytomonas sp. Hart1]|nr:unnamed protein product [Phytomonas sp. Hart1]|eukprot:CCW69406.1 unnamed protein product [Phytomonas sp. isolate Hart1]